MVRGQKKYEYDLESRVAHRALRRERYMAQRERKKKPVTSQGRRPTTRSLGRIQEHAGEGLNQDEDTIYGSLAAQVDDALDEEYESHGQVGDVESDDGEGEHVSGSLAEHDAESMSHTALTRLI